MQLVINTLSLCTNSRLPQMSVEHPLLELLTTHSHNAFSKFNLLEGLMNSSNVFSHWVTHLLQVRLKNANEQSDKKIKTEQDLHSSRTEGLRSSSA